MLQTISEKLSTGDTVEVPALGHSPFQIYAIDVFENLMEENEDGKTKLQQLGININILHDPRK